MHGCLQSVNATSDQLRPLTIDRRQTFSSVNSKRQAIHGWLSMPAANSALVPFDADSLLGTINVSQQNHRSKSAICTTHGGRET